jgi:hypothetical protein
VREAKFPFDIRPSGERSAAVREIIRMGSFLDDINFPERLDRGLDRSSMESCLIIQTVASNSQRSSFALISALAIQRRSHTLFTQREHKPFESGVPTGRDLFCGNVF